MILHLNESMNRGLALGDGYFTTILVKRGIPYCFNAHYERLAQSGKLFQIPFPYAKDELKNLIKQESENYEEAVCRIMVVRGNYAGFPISGDEKNEVFINIKPYQRDDTPVRVIEMKALCEVKYPLSQYKTLGYQNSILGHLYAKENGVDDVLFFNDRDEIIGTTTGNIFLKIEEAWYTPPLSVGCVAGIKRSEIVSKRPEIKIKKIYRKDLKKVTEAFYANSLVGVRSIFSINRKSSLRSTFKF